MTEVAKTRQPAVIGGLLEDEITHKFRYLNIMFHAFGGHGKTTVLASACLDPRLHPILVLDIEGGAPLRFAHMPKETYTIRRVKNVEELNKYYEYLRKGDHPYKSVAIDSFTELQKMGLLEFVYGKGNKGKIDEIKTAEIQHWGRSGNQMSMVARFFRDLEMHVFLTTLTQVIKDELTGKITYGAALPGKQADEIPGIPDFVGYISMEKNTETKQEQRYCYWQPTSRIVAKDRSDSLGKGMWISDKDDFLSQMLDRVWKKYGITE